jgi:hypothetical protein
MVTGKRARKMDKDIIGYAVVQLCGPVWAVGQTREATMLEYERECPDGDTPIEWSERHNATDSMPIVIVEATSDLIEKVYQYGGDLRYDIDDHGCLGIATLPND